MKRITNAFTNKSELIKSELYFDINGFNIPKTDEDLYSLGKKIENLLLLRPGTYPNSPLMGINIEKYAFELITDENMDRINK